MVAEALTAPDPVKGEAVDPYPAASRGGSGGFYVDIEAEHPIEDSVSLEFHRRGWRGVNVISDPERFRLFAELRAGDTNVNALVGETAEPVGTEPPPDGRSPVPKLSLSDVLDRYGPVDGNISFLKISAGARTASILQGSNWDRHRPDMIVLDSLGPDDEREDGSRALGELGYRLAFFDGRRRIFCRTAVDRGGAGLTIRGGGLRENGTRGRRVSPIRVDARLEALGLDAEEARAELREVRSELAVARGAAALAESSLAVMHAELEALRASAGAAEVRSGVLSVELARALQAAAAAQRREEAVEAELAVQEGVRYLSSTGRNPEPAEMDAMLEAHRSAVLHHQRAHEELALWRESVRVSTSWRLTRPMRVIGRYLKRLYRVRRG